MSLLSNLGQGMAGQVIGQLVGTGDNKLIGAAAKLISGGNVGGLAGLTQLFAQRGHGEAVNSWVSSQRNQAISADDVQQVLGQDRVREVAQDAGVSEPEAAQGLSSVLPQLVDRLTPDGKLPDSNTANNTLSQVARQFLGRQ